MRYFPILCTLKKTDATMNATFKAILLLLLVLVTGIGTAHPQSTRRKTVGVALSGGGAKGAAHIGVLRALEAQGIPVDYVAGTSMGAVIGGLYAMGYTPDQLDSIIKAQDWTLLLSDNTTLKSQTLAERENTSKYVVSIPLKKSTKKLGGLVQGRNLFTRLTQLTIGYHDSIDFDRLPVPFACVATNLADGSEYVFRSGRLAVAIRSSMAIPAVFTPVPIHGMVLADGGLVNNYPVDVVREMGADIVIGVTLDEDLPSAENITGLSDVLTRLLDIMCQNKFAENVSRTDLHLKIDVTGVGMLDFTPAKVDTMVSRGWRTAMANAATLDSIRRVIYGAEEAEHAALTCGTRAPLKMRQTIELDSISYIGCSPREMNIVLRKSRLREGETADIAQIEEALRIFHDELNYPDAYYSLEETGDRYSLLFYVADKKLSTLMAGVRFDNKDIISGQVKGVYYFDSKSPQYLSLTGRIGKQYMARVEYAIEPSLLRSINLAYEFHRGDVDIDSRGDRLYNLIFRQHSAEVRVCDLSARNLQLELGFRLDHYDYNSLLSDGSDTESLPTLKKDTYYDYFFMMKYSSMDRSYYPTRGADFYARYTLLTDNFYQYADKNPVSCVEAAWSGAFSLSESFALLPSFRGRALFGTDIALMHRNAIGGNWAGKYLPQQLTFAGVVDTELVDRCLLIGGLTVRQRLFGEHYLSLTGDFATVSHNVDGIFSERFLYGADLKYGYNTKLGPLELDLSYSKQCKTLYLFVNAGCYF